MFNCIPVGEYNEDSYAIFILANRTIYGSGKQAHTFAPQPDHYYTYRFGPIVGNPHRLNGYHDADAVGGFLMHQNHSKDMVKLWSMIEDYATSDNNAMRYREAAKAIIRARKIDSLETQ